jgi:hypothetical protein
MDAMAAQRARLKPGGREDCSKLNGFWQRQFQ